MQDGSCRNVLSRETKSDALLQGFHPASLINFPYGPLFIAQKALS